MVKKIIILFTIFFTLYTLHFTLIYAADKTWGGGGDGTNWSDEDNWYLAEVPTLSDDVLIDMENGSITVDQTFIAKALTVGGKESTTVTTGNFIFGEIKPDAVTDLAIINRFGGKIVSSGLGVITLKGKYKSTKDTSGSVSEPSFMFWIE